MLLAPFRYAYLHGFGGSPRSHKGVELAKTFAAHGLDLARPNLNVPSFERLTYTSALDALDALDERAGATATWRFIGSSLGGYLAALWAQQHPTRVDRLLLLCPGFDLIDRWPALISPEAFERWRRDGAAPFAAPDGGLRPVSWAFIEDARRHPKRPCPPQPTLVVHGAQDPVVPIGSSRRWVSDHPSARLVTVDDTHDLHQSLPQIAAEAVSFFGLDR